MNKQEIIKEINVMYEFRKSVIESVENIFINSKYDFLTIDELNKIKELKKMYRNITKDIRVLEKGGQK